MIHILHPSEVHKHLYRIMIWSSALDLKCISPMHRLVVVILISPPVVLANSRNKKTKQTNKEQKTKKEQKQKQNKTKKERHKTKTKIKKQKRNKTKRKQ